MILMTVRRRAVASASLFAAGVLSAPLFSPCDAQNREEREIRIARVPGGVTILRGAPGNRAVLGVTLGEGSRADTAGVRLEGVNADSPAGKAGLKAGDIITEINGTSLKVSREDADDLALAGLAQRRLQRHVESEAGRRRAASGAQRQRDPHGHREGGVGGRARPGG